MPTCPWCGAALHVPVICCLKCGKALPIQTPLPPAQTLGQPESAPTCNVAHPELPMPKPTSVPPASKPAVTQQGMPQVSNAVDWKQNRKITPTYTSEDGTSPVRESTAPPALSWSRHPPAPHKLRTSPGIQQVQQQPENQVSPHPSSAPAVSASAKPLPARTIIAPGAFAQAATRTGSSPPAATSQPPTANPIKAPSRPPSKAPARTIIAPGAFAQAATQTGSSPPAAASQPPAVQPAKTSSKPPSNPPSTPSSRPSSKPPSYPVFVPSVCASSVSLATPPEPAPPSDSRKATVLGVAVPGIAPIHRSEGARDAGPDTRHVQTDTAGSPQSNNYGVHHGRRLHPRTEIGVAMPGIAPVFDDPQAPEHTDAPPQQTEPYHQSPGQAPHPAYAYPAADLSLAAREGASATQASAIAVASPQIPLSPPAPPTPPAPLPTVPPPAHSVTPAPQSTPIQQMASPESSEVFSDPYNSANGSAPWSSHAHATSSDEPTASEPTASEATASEPTAPVREGSHRSASRYAVIALGVVTVAIAVSVGIFYVFLTFWPSKAAVSSRAMVDEQGRDVLALECASCADGTRISIRNDTAKVHGSVARVTLSRPLQVGDNVMPVRIDHANNGRTETVTLRVPIAFRVRQKLDGLQQAKPTVGIEVRTLAGTRVKIDGAILSLDNEGKGQHDIDVLAQCTGQNAQVVTIERAVGYSIEPPSRAPIQGTVPISVAVSPLVLYAPSTRAVVDTDSIELAGWSGPRATVRVGDTLVTVANDGSFRHRVSLPNEGSTTIEIRGQLPGYAPRTAQLTVKRVANLRAEAKALEAGPQLDIAAFLTDPEKYRDQPVMVRGQVLDVAPQTVNRIILLDVAGKCPAPPCLVRVVYAGTTEIEKGSHVQVFGHVKGGFESMGKTSAEMVADFLIVDRGSVSRQRR